MFTDKKRICFFIYSDVFAGAEKVVLDEINYLNQDKFEISLITSSAQVNLFKDGLTKKVQIFEISLQRNPISMLFDLKTIKSISDFINQEKIETLSLHNNQASLAGTFSCFFKRKVKIVITEHNNLINPEIQIAQQRNQNKIFKRHINLGWLFYLLLRHLIDFKVSLYIAVSASVKNFIVEGLGHKEEKIKIFNNGIDIKKFIYNYKQSKSLYEELGLPQKTKLIGIIGRLDIQKGHKYFIKSVPALIEGIPDVHIVFVGDGPLRQTLTKQIKELHIEKHISLLGFRKDVIEILKNLDIMVLPSLWEGLPITVLESMSMGVPVIASAVDGTVDVIQDGVNGLMFPPKDVSVLTTKVMTMLRDDSLRENISFAGRQRIEECFTIEDRVSKLEKCLL